MPVHPLRGMRYYGCFSCVRDHGGHDRYDAGFSLLPEGQTGYSASASVS